MTYSALATAVLIVGVQGAYASTTPQPRVGEPLPDLTQDELDRFILGKTMYARDLTVSEGRGPIFNQTACGDCHNNPIGGTGTQKVLRAGLAGKGPFDPLTEFGGSLFQLEAISPECMEVVPPQANVMTDRVTNGMMGYGLVEAIDDADILMIQALQDPSIQGTVHMVEPFEDPGQLRVGRFGWKAQVATILTFSADASLNEMGLTNRFLTQENDPNGINPPSLGAPDFCDTVPDPEDSVALGNGVDRDFIDVVTDFQRFMVAPPQTPKSGMTGETIFNSIGCADCHVPSYTTPNDLTLEAALRNKVIRPYSDFLLHEMGLNGDGIVQGISSPGELKTPPLMGLIQRQELWHDGRFGSGTFAQKVTLAIAEHDDGIAVSQGRFAAQAFAALSANDQNAVIAFLGSLGRREFDLNLDDKVTIFDFHGMGDPAAFKACFGGGPYSPDDPCAIHDIDQDTDVHFGDFKAFGTVYSGALADCNGNTILDLIDILNGTSLDNDDNGIPDECEPTCTGDLDGDNNVGFTDMLVMFGEWGLCPTPPAPCNSDIDIDGVVGIVDLFAMFGLWGPCS